MGSSVWIDKAQFRMSAAGERAAIAALKAAFPSEQSFLARGIHEKPAAYQILLNSSSLAGAIRAVAGLDEHVIVHEMAEGGVASLGREGMMDELPTRAIARFFAVIAHFVEPGSFIEFESDQSSCWTRFEFRGTGLRVVERELGADSLGDWGIIEHDRTEVLLDPTL
jgi:hypothetical protein